jgi:hypothetical protein
MKRIRLIDDRAAECCLSGEGLMEDETQADAIDERPAISAAAKRALAEADERRRSEAAKQARPPEIGGRGGLDPARYGDWEIKGIASDF